MKAYWRYSKSKTVHDWVLAARATFMASVCGAYKEVRPEEFVTTLTGQPECKHCERMGK